VSDSIGFGCRFGIRHIPTGAEVSFGHFGTILAGLDSLVVTA